MNLYVKNFVKKCGEALIQSNLNAYVYMIKCLEIQVRESSPRNILEYTF